MFLSKTAATIRREWVIVATFRCMACLLLIFAYLVIRKKLPVEFRVHKIVVNTSDVIFVTNKEYLSIAIDSSLIRNGWVRRNICSKKLIALTRPLVPAYLRVGGTAADQLIFTPGEEVEEQDLLLSKSIQLPDAVPENYCDYGDQCKRNMTDTFYMTAKEWWMINHFVKQTGLSLIFDLNVLLRHNNTWDSTNARKLLTMSTDFACNVSWQLGNEPNSFEHVFGIRIAAMQLGEDFRMLRKLLDEFPSCYKNAMLVGPDVTRPKLMKLPSASYMHNFLRTTNGTINAATFHQYYVNGRTATLNDFVDPNVFDRLHDEINIMKMAVHTVDSKLPVWLTETSSAWGGGAKDLSDRYVAGFLWLDKLGVAAKFGIKLVVRQSLCGGYYSLLDCAKFEPRPDWWLSVLFKKLVGQKVLSVKSTKSGLVRMYAHCANPDIGQGLVSIFGLNAGDEPVWLDIDGIEGPSHAYILNGESGLHSKTVLLNGKKLQLNADRTLPPMSPVNISLDEKVMFPSFSLGFWVTTIHRVPECCMP